MKFSWIQGVGTSVVMVCALRAAPVWMVAIGLFVGATVEAAPVIALSGRAMGTTWSVKFFQPVPAIDQGVVEKQVADKLEYLEQQFSTYRTQSELSRFNAVTHTGWVPVSAELARVAKESRLISELTAGAFDVTVEPLGRLMGFGAKGRSGSQPTAAELAEVRDLVGWRRLEVSTKPPAIRKTKPGISADFSSMAKGFAVDVVSELLVSLGAMNHLVAVGGDLKASGRGGDGHGWRAAVEKPLEETEEMAAVVTLAGGAMSTSGNYRNFLQRGGRRYGHIIDPRTGLPPAHSLAAVSVIHSSCATSSALATALFVLGSEEGLRLAKEQSLACFFVIREGDLWVKRATPEFERFMRTDRPR